MKKLNENNDNNDKNDRDTNSNAVNKGKHEIKIENFDNVNNDDLEFKQHLISPHLPSNIILCFFNYYLYY